MSDPDRSHDHPPVPAAIIALAWLYLVTVGVLGVGAAIVWRVWRWVRGMV